jgi:hypothetical protein
LARGNDPKASDSSAYGPSREFDRALAAFWVRSRPADLGAQPRQEDQSVIRTRYKANRLLDQIGEV